jgi:ABC-2 type transport system permease protein
MTHGIDAARRLADGARLGDVWGLVGRETALGVGYVLVGLVLLTYFEWDSRRRATLEVF